MWIKDGNKLVISRGIALVLDGTKNVWRIWYGEDFNYRNLESEKLGLFILSSINNAILHDDKLIDLDLLCKKYDEMVIALKETIA